MKPVRFIIAILVITGLSLGGLTIAQAAAEHQTYTVEAGDTLWDISKRFYGDDSLWPKLWELNRYQTTNPHRIEVGDVLTIYPLEELKKAKAPPSPPPCST